MIKFCKRTTFSVSLSLREQCGRQHSVQVSTFQRQSCTEVSLFDRFSRCYSFGNYMSELVLISDWIKKSGASFLSQS